MIPWHPSSAAAHIQRARIAGPAQHRSTVWFIRLLSSIVWYGAYLGNALSNTAGERMCLASRQAEEGPCFEKQWPGFPRPSQGNQGVSQQPTDVASLELSVGRRRVRVCDPRAQERFSAGVVALPTSHIRKGKHVGKCGKRAILKFGANADRAGEGGVEVRR